MPKEELASYDYKGIKARGGGYVLESGEYEISIRQNSHDVIEKRSFTQSGDIIYDENNARKSDEKSASNRFDDISEMFKDSPTTGYARNMSRADFAGTFPTPPSVENKDFDPTYVNFQTAQQNGGKTVKAGLAPFDVNTDPALGNVTTSKIYESVAPTVTNTSSGVYLTVSI